MNDTLLRHWYMLREVPRYPRKIDAGTLLERLERAGYDTSLRTIQRDLIKLSGALPLVADEAKPQGWSWRADAPLLDLPALDPQAAIVFHLAERYLHALLPASTLDYLSPWFQTAAGVLDAQGNGLSAWRKKVRVLAPGQPLTPPAIDHDSQATITQALLQGKQVSLQYRPRNATSPKEYVANPLALVVRDQTIYLVCTLWDYPDLKQLALHRVASAEMLDTPAHERPDFDLDAYIAQGEFGLPKETGKRIKLIARFDRRAALHILEKPLEEGQKVVELDEATVELTATVADTLELRTWLLGFGDKVEVMAPAALRREFSESVARMAARYQAGNTR